MRICFENFQTPSSRPEDWIIELGIGKANYGKSCFKEIMEA